jgi:hypothetical protein
MGRFHEFPVPAVTFSSQNPSFIPSYPMTLFIGCWANFYCSRRPSLRLWVCSRSCTARGLTCIFSSIVIPKISLTRLSIPRAAVRIEKKGLWALYIYRVCEGCFRKVQTYRESLTLGRPSKLNSLRSSLMKTRPERD